jgi:hypothetical protein
MKAIIKNLGTLTKILFVALLITGISADSFAQKKKKNKKEKAAKELKRPAKMGHAATDSYVTSAFDLYEKNQSITKKLSDATNNVGDAGKIKADLEGQMKEVTGLLGKSADVMKEAKTITPKTDSMKAVKALNAGTKALNATKEAIPGQLESIKTQSK